MDMIDKVCEMTYIKEFKEKLRAARKYNLLVVPREMKEATTHLSRW